MTDLSFMLKPCFCGGKRTIEYKTHTAGMGEGYANWEMRCDKCHGLWTLSADNFYGSTPYTQGEVIKIWNDMVTESADEMGAIRMTNAEKFKDVFGIDFWENIRNGNLESGRWADEEYKLLEFDKISRDGTCKDCAKSKISNDDFEGYGLVCSRFGRMAVNPDFEKRGEKND